MNALEEIKKALEDVTPGPWFEGDKWVFVSPRSGLMNEALENVLRNDEAQANARYIAAVNPAVMSELLSTIESLQREKEAKTSWAFAEGDLVRKKSGSWWEGFVVGTYSTMQTPRGYAVQLAHEFGPVQIYPESALELVLAKMSEAELIDALSALQSE